MTTLFNLGDEAAALYDALTAERLDERGAPVVLTEDEQSAIIDAYLEAEGKVETKVDAYCHLISEFKLRGQARQIESDRLDALAARDAKQAKGLEARLHAYFTLHGITKMETALHKLSIVKSGGKLAVVISADANPCDIDVDERFQRVIPATVEFDKDEVRKALEAGEKLPFACLGKRGERLSIK